MKKASVFVLLFCLLMLTACGKGGAQDSESETHVVTPVEMTTDESTTLSPEVSERVDLGLGVLKKENNDGINIRSVRLTGSRHEVGRNNANEGLGALYTDETVIFHIACDYKKAGGKAVVYCVSHSDSHKAEYSPDEYIFRADFRDGTFPEPGNNGNFSATPKAGTNPGYYDLVFTYNNSVAAMVTIELMGENNEK